MFGLYFRNGRLRGWCGHDRVILRSPDDTAASVLLLTVIAVYVDKVLPVDKAKKIPGCQFSSKNLACSLVGYKAPGNRQQASESTANLVTWNAKGVCRWLFQILVRQSLGHSSPITPATMVFAGKALR